MRPLRKYRWKKPRGRPHYSWARRRNCGARGRRRSRFRRNLDPSLLIALHRRRNLDPTRLTALRRRNRLDPTRLTALRRRNRLDPTRLTALRRNRLDPTRLTALRRRNRLDPTRLTAFKRNCGTRNYSRFRRNLYRRNPYRRNPDPNGKPWGPNLYNPLKDKLNKFKNESHYVKMISKLRRNPW